MAVFRLASPSRHVPNLRPCLPARLATWLSSLKRVCRFRWV